MTELKALPIIIPPYRHASVEPSTFRSVLVLLIKLGGAVLCGVGAVMLPPQMAYLLVVPTVVCLAVVLWLLPDRGFFPLKAMTRIYTIYLVLMVIWPVYIAVVLPGLPWLTPTRMALLIFTFIFLYSVSVSGALRQHLWTVARASTGVWVAFLLWNVSQIISAPFSTNITLTVKKFLDNQLNYNEVFFIGCLLFSIRGNATRTIGWLIVLAVLCSFDGFVEYKLEYPPWAHHIPSFMRVDEATMANMLGSQARSTDGIYRVRGPFALSLVFAEYLALCMPFILHWLVTGRSLALRLAMVLAWILVFMAIWITQSRLGAVGAIVAHIVYLPVWAYRRWKADNSALLGPFILFGTPVAAIVALGVIFSSHTLTAKIMGGPAAAASNAARATQRAMAIPKVLHNPIGHGLGQSGTVLGFANAGGYITVDNHYITTSLDLGVLGLVSFYGMFLIAAWIGIKMFVNTTDRETELAGPLAIMFLVFFVIKSVLSQDNNHSLVLLLLGMLVALWARERKLVDPETLFLPSI